MRMRDPFLPKQCLTHLDTGSAKHFVCFPLIQPPQKHNKKQSFFVVTNYLMQPTALEKSRMKLGFNDNTLYLERVARNS